ncbi:MAG: thiamine-phosphate kinase [Phycisphaerales bacterium]
MRESDLLHHIAARSQGLAAGAGWLVLSGPGDDCAVMQSQSGDVTLLTVDQLVAGRHFKSETHLDLIARKAVARSVSDIAAMGGVPAWGLATGLLPKDYPHANALFDAMAKWAKHFGCPLVGGDVAMHASPDHPLTLSVTIGGSMAGETKPVLRSGAQAGDSVWITGPVGGSFSSGRHLTFEPRIEIGQRLAAAGAHAMIDLSDGVGRDTDRIAKASGVTIEIDTARVTWHPGVENWQAGVSDGEDYELLVVGSAGLAEAVDGLLGPIGHVSNGDPGAWFIDGADTRHAATDMGWDHR